MNPFRAVPFLLTLGVLVQTTAFAQYRGVAGDVFTYQGELRYEGNLVDGDYDVQFTILSDGAVVDTIPINNLTFDNGVFSTDIQLNNFFRDLMDPEVAISIFDLNSPGGTIAFPRRPIVAAPYAYVAEGVANNVIDSDSIVNSSITASDVDSSQIQHRVVGICGSSEAIRAINGNGSVDCVDVGGAAGGWALTGNAGTSVGTNFIGTTDDVAFDVRVNDQRAMRFQWGFNAAGSPNIVAGHANNSIAGSEEASTIAGGGLAAAPNTISSSYSFIGGGIANSIDANYGAILGGKNNEVSGTDGVAIGSNAKALHKNTFVFSDGSAFASTADDQFLIEADGGVGIGVNNPSDFVHISAPAGGDAFRIQLGGTTRLRVHDNGGVSVGVNANPPSAGLLVQGELRTNTPVTRYLALSSGDFVPYSSSLSILMFYSGISILSSAPSSEAELVGGVDLPQRCSNHTISGIGFG